MEGWWAAGVERVLKDLAGGAVEPRQLWPAEGGPSGAVAKVDQIDPTPSLRHERRGVELADGSIGVSGGGERVEHRFQRFGVREQAAHILEEKRLRPAGLSNADQLVEQRATIVGEAAKPAGIGKRLARESGGKHIVRRDLRGCDRSHVAYRTR